MLRYVAINWNERDEEDTLASASLREQFRRIHRTWQRAMDAPGLCVLCSCESGRVDHGVVSIGTHGIVLGTLLRRRPLCASPPIARFEASEIEELIRSDGRSILESHWGSYIMVLRRARGGCLILRSPLGAIPCYYLDWGNITVAFSVADDLAAVNRFRFSINWPRIRAQVASSDYLNGETGLTEIRSLDAGSCLSRLGAGYGVHEWWSPGSASADARVTDFSDAAAELRGIALSCVGSWASGFACILLTLSGGLDSSIVLACAARAPTRPSLWCVNFHSQALGDEREFARSMARHVGVRLVEWERDPSLDLRRLLRCNRTVSPVLHLTGFESEPIAVRLAGEFRASAIFNGELGDNLFGSGVRREILAEFVRRYGFSSSLIPVAIDYAHLRRTTVWHALWLALRARSFQRVEWSGARYGRVVLGISAESRLASAEAIAAAESVSNRYVHPWSRSAERLPSGKRQLLYALQVISSTSYESPFMSPEDPPVIAPLASQPLVEFALGVPTHFHIRGGLNRALARSAFAEYLPSPVLARGRGKGSPSLWLRMLVERNRPFLRELLLDGILIREKLLDRRKVERTLSASIRESAAAMPDVIAQAYIEAWLRTWAASGQCKAA